MEKKWSSKLKLAADVATSMLALLEYALTLCKPFALGVPSLYGVP